MTEEVTETKEVKEPGIFGEIYQKLFGEHWDMWIGSIIIAMLSMALFLLAQPFGASCALSSVGGRIYNIFGLADFSGATAISMCAWSLITVFLGAMGAALLSNEYSLRIPPIGELVKGLIGGVLMAFGAVLGKGCTLGSFFSGWPSLSAGALTFAAGLAIGAFAAAKWLVFEVDKLPQISQGKSYNLTFGTKKKFIQPIIGVIIIAIAILFPMIFPTQPDFKKGFMVIGVFIGIVLQRSRWCVVRALREPWMSGDSKPMRAIMLGIAVSMIGFVTFKFIFPDFELPTGTTVERTFVFPNFWLRGLIGGTIFGVGMVLAGGCAAGSIWRAGEGQTKLMISTLVMLFLIPIVGKYIAPGFVAALPDSGKQAIFLPDVLGGVGSGGYYVAILLVLGIGFIWYVLIRWNDKTKKFAAF